MQVKFRILSTNEQENAVLVRYFTDLVTEKQLSTNPQETEDNPKRCRTDLNLTLDPQVLDTKEKVHDLIMRQAPRGFLRMMSYPEDSSFDFTLLSDLTQGENTERVLSLEEEKANRNQLLWRDYINSIQQNVTYNGYEMYGDLWTQLMISKVIAAGEIPPDFVWNTADNNAVPMTLETLQAYASTIMDKAYQQFKKLQVKKAEVRAASTVSEVKAVVWETANEV